MINKIYKWAYPEASIMSDTYSHEIYNGYLTNDGIYFYYNEYMYSTPNEIYKKNIDVCPTIKLSALDVFEADYFDDFSKYGFNKFGGRWFKTMDKIDGNLILHYK